MNTENSSNSSTGHPRNTKQDAPAKHWVFTWNNYPIELVELIKLHSSISKCSYQEEICPTTGTPHLQGYVAFTSKLRFTAIKKIFPKEIHWEKKRTTIKNCIEYSQKLESRKPGGKIWRKGIPLIRALKCLKPTDLYPWQQEIVDIVQDEPDDRTIHWYWEKTGNVGKSALVRYLVIHHDAIVIAGKGADIKYQIKSFQESKGYSPEIILYDIPRSRLEYVNYTAIEEIKNGIFSSSKYESKMVIMNPPHIMCFANNLPDISRMSADRWKINNINGEDELSEDNF